MSTVYQIICDQCGQIHEKKTGEDCTPYDPDEFWGWIHVSGTVDVWDMDGDSSLDFCGIKCTAEWAQIRKKAWKEFG